MGLHASVEQWDLRYPINKMGKIYNFVEVLESWGPYVKRDQLNHRLEHAWQPGCVGVLKKDSEDVLEVSFH